MRRKKKIICGRRGITREKFEFFMYCQKTRIQYFLSRLNFFGRVKRLISKLINFRKRIKVKNEAGMWCIYNDGTSTFYAKGSRVWEPLKNSDKKTISNNVRYSDRNIKPFTFIATNVEDSFYADLSFEEIEEIEEINEISQIGEITEISEFIFDLDDEDFGNWLLCEVVCDGIWVDEMNYPGRSFLAKGSRFVIEVDSYTMQNVDDYVRFYDLRENPEIYLEHIPNLVSQ